MSAGGPSADPGRQLLASDDPKVQRLVAAGLAPMPLAELLDAQVAMACGADGELAETARRSLEETDPKMVASVLAEDPTEAVLHFYARPDQHPVIVESILRRRDVPRDLLISMAGGLEADQQEVLLLRQDAIVEQPEILDALEDNPKLSSYAVRRIAEYREHLLPHVRRLAAVEAGEIVEVEPEVEADDPEVAEIRAHFQAVEDGKSDDELEDLWKASEIKIRSLSVPVRMKLARGATPLLRRILIRDQNPTVALAIMTTSPITEPEVERIALSRIVIDDVLTHIANSKKWARKYKVIHALCQNPRTPVNVVMKLLPRLSARHLQLLSRNRNVSEAARTRALRLYRIKIQ